MDARRAFWQGAGMIRAELSGACALCRRRLFARGAGLRV